MTEDSERLWRLIVGAVVGLASVAVTLVAYDAQMDGSILKEIRPRMRWAWRSLTAMVTASMHAPEVVAGAEAACESSPWRPTWNVPRETSEKEQS